MYPIDPFVLELMTNRGSMLNSASLTLENLIFMPSSIQLYNLFHPHYLIANLFPTS